MGAVVATLMKMMMFKWLRVATEDTNQIFTGMGMTFLIMTPMKMRRVGILKMIQELTRASCQIAIIIDKVI
jgi:hypothetical protein